MVYLASEVVEWQVAVHKAWLQAHALLPKNLHGLAIRNALLHWYGSQGRLAYVNALPDIQGHKSAYLGSQVEVTKRGRPHCAEAFWH